MIQKILSIAAIGAMAIVPPSKVDLKFALEKGKTYTQVTEVESVTKQTMMGQENNSENGATSSTMFELLESADQSGIYHLWYDNIAMNFTGMGQEVKFSSDDLESPVGEVLSKMVKKKFQVRIGHYGDISDISGLEEMIAAVSTNEDGSPNEVGEQISASYGDEGLANNLEIGINIFAGKAVKKGESWKKKQFSSSGLPLIIDCTYTLVSIGDASVEIDVTGTISVDPENNTGDLQGMEVTYFLEGSRTGSLTVETSTGWVTSGTFTDDIAGSISIAESPMVPDGMTIPTEILNKTTITGTSVAN